MYTYLMWVIASISHYHFNVQYSYFFNCSVVHYRVSVYLAIITVTQLLPLNSFCCISFFGFFQFCMQTATNN